jgi:hypothetical protein
MQVIDLEKKDGKQVSDKINIRQEEFGHLK